MELKEGIARQERMRATNNDRWEERHNVQNDRFAVGDIVLLYDVILDKEFTANLSNRWLSPYIIRTANAATGTYELSELDGTPRQSTVHGNRLKHLVLREPLEEGGGNISGNILHKLYDIGRSQSI